MKRIAMVSALFNCWFAVNSIHTISHPQPGTQSSEGLSFETKLDTRVERFETSGRTLVAILPNLAYDYQLPMGIEYIDHEAVTRPINLEFHNESVRGILLASIQQVPGYRVSFSGGLLDIYTDSARDNPSNLLNKIIKNFDVTGVDTRFADLALFRRLGREVEPDKASFASVALGQWGQQEITLHLQNAKVYEILNAIVAQNGRAVWTVMVPPQGLSTTPVSNLWHIYPLERSFKGAVLDRLTSMSVEETKQEKTP